MKELLYINRYFWKYKFHLLSGVFFVALSNFFQIIPAQVVRHAFDMVHDTLRLIPLYEGFESKSAMLELFMHSVIVYGGILVIMAIIRGVLLFMMRQTLIVMSRKIEYDLKNDIYQKYQELPLSFYKKNSTGDLVARISEDVAKVRMYVGPGIMYSINTVVTCILVISYMFSVNVELTLYALIPLPILSLCVYYVNNIINQRSTKVQEKLSDISTYVQEAFSGIRVIKAFVKEKQYAENFEKESEEYMRSSIHLTRANAIFIPLIMLLMGISVTLTVYIGGKEVIDGVITPGNIAEFIIYINMLVWPVTSIGWVTSIIQQAEASQKRINEFMKLHTDIISKKNITQPIKGCITFDEVNFTYPNSGMEALKNITFSLENGEILAILGTTGSGKSTIANLLCRMYDTSSGKILIDGVDIKDYNPSFLRSNFGYVPQDVFLFSESIRNNINFGLERRASDEEIHKAAKDADLYENIVQFEKGFETVLGERGITLSGGQKQRTSIARALILSPKVLILDDALSAVDTKTENAILTSLKRVMKDKTAIIISHRVSSAKMADKILMLDEGRMIALGTHDELMKSSEEYIDLYSKQITGESTHS